MTDLKKLQINYYNAVVINANQANESIRSAQGWLLGLATAELAFAGALILSPILQNQFFYVNILLTIAVALLIMSFFSFFIGCYFQFKHILEVSREYNKLSNTVVEFMESQKIIEIDKLPSFLSDKNIDKLKSSHDANKYFLISFFSLGLATLILFFAILIFLLNR